MHMKIACVLGSPRREGNSAMIAQRFLDKAAILGAEAETFSLNTLSYRGCQACYACKTKLDRCILKDDLSRVLHAVQEADVLVLATPTYYGDISGQLKCFIDRTYSYLKPDYLSNSQPSRLAPGKKLLFMGSEFGQWDEWNHDKSIDWHLLEFTPHKGLQKYVTDLNRIYHSEPALYEVDFHHKGFGWIDFHDTDHSIISFLRAAKDPDNFLVIVCNFTPVPRTGYRVGVPYAGFYKEILNSDAKIYWGSNMGNAGGLNADAIPWHGKQYSILITLPPLSVLILKPLKH